MPVPRRRLLAMAALVPIAAVSPVQPPRRVASTGLPSIYDRLPPSSYNSDIGEPDGRRGRLLPDKVVQVPTHLPVGRRSSRGTEVHYRDGHVQVLSYDLIDAAEHATRGDPMLLCVVSIPPDCPAGDFPGVMYRTIDLRCKLVVGDA